MAGIRNESGSTASPGTGRVVSCIHCRTPMKVAEKAETATCPSCYKRQTVRDVVVDNDRTGSRVETTGILFIKRKGRVWAPGVKAGDAVEVLGELKADVVTHGHVVIGESARWRGNCTAKLLVVEDGARIDGGFFRIDPRGELAAEAEALSALANEKIDVIEEAKPVELREDGLVLGPVERQATPEPPMWAGAAI